MAKVDDCLFCSSEFYSENKIIHESDDWYAVYDGFPVVKGHTLIIPKKHIQSIFELSEISTLFSFIKEALKRLSHTQFIFSPVNKSK